MSNIYKDWQISVTQKLADPKNKGALIIDVEAVKGKDTIVRNFHGISSQEMLTQAVRGGKDTIVRNFHGIISQEMLTQAVRGWIDTIESAKSVNDSIDFTVTEKPEPEPVDTKREEWNRDREQLRQVMELVRDGVFPANDAKVAALQNKVRTGFKVGYLG